MTFELKGLVELLKYFEERWHRRSTLLIIFLLLIIVVLFVSTKVKLSEIDVTWYIFIAVLMVIFFSIWKYTTRVSKTRKGRVGFVIAITHEDKSKKSKIKTDFIRCLDELLQSGSLRHQFELIELNEFHTSKIKDRETAVEYLTISKSHILLYGIVRERPFQGSLHHFLNLHCVVSHKPIPIEVSRSLSREMTELIPGKLQIPEEGEIFAFEFTAKWIDLFARYITGIASMLSLDLDYAAELFEDLQNKLLTTNDKLPAILKIKSRVPGRLMTIHNTQLWLQYNSWRATREREIIEKMEPTVDKLLLLNPIDYQGNLLKAICHFMLRRDVKSAKKQINQCKKMDDATWLYSEAFLYAYDGHLKSAKQKYYKAFKRQLDEISVPVQTEEFILDVLDSEPDKVQLFYCLGLVNYHAKQDYVVAKRDFEQFLAKCPDGQYSKEKEEAVDMIKQIEGMIKKQHVQT